MTQDKTMWTIQQICDFYGLSEQTIRRRIRDAKAKKSSFPKPVFGYGRKGLWHAEDIINWSEKGRTANSSSSGGGRALVIALQNKRLQQRTNALTLESCCSWLKTFMLFYMI